MVPLPITQLLHAGDSTAFYTTRGSCLPELPYSGFNLCHYTGDYPAHIAACRDALSRHFGISAERILIPRQTHSANVAVITSLPVVTPALEGIDALVSDMRNIIIGVNTADCVPVVLLDPITGVNGVAHAGWRGAVGGVVEATVNAMIQLGSCPSNIKAAMGPSICRHCFEVGQEVASFFDKDCVFQSPGGKPHVSLHKYISKILITHGLKSDNVSNFNDGICTLCHPASYWSARKMGINSGRIYTFIVKK